MPLSPDLTFEEFVTGHGNQLAHAAAVAVANHPGSNDGGGEGGYNPLFIHGDVGLGKTHLLQAICQTVLDRDPRSRILYLSCEAFISPVHQRRGVEGDEQRSGNRYRHVDVLGHRRRALSWQGPRADTQEEFFHTFNTLRDNCRSRSCSAPTARAPGEIPELDRAADQPVQLGDGRADLTSPGYETRVAIVKQEGADLGPGAARRRGRRSWRPGHQNNIRELEGALRTLGGVLPTSTGPRR